jgi:hypothetical protein
VRSRATSAKRARATPSHYIVLVPECSTSRSTPWREKLYQSSSSRRSERHHLMSTSDNVYGCRHSRLEGTMHTIDVMSRGNGPAEYAGYDKRWTVTAHCAPVSSTPTSSRSASGPPTGAATR